MRRPFWFRALLTLWAIWFTTALTEPAGLFACAMHSGLGDSAVTNEAIGFAVAPMHGHNHAAMAAVADETPNVTPRAASVQGDESSHHKQTGHNCCTCLGKCCTMSPALVAGRVEVPTFLVPLASASIGPTYHVRVAIRTPHALPFANGPPLTLL